MRIKLLEQRVEYFKNHVRFGFKPEGENASLRGPNGSGKTSGGPDAFYWLHYDKASDGRKKFGTRPVDTDPESPHYKEPIKGLVVVVEDKLLINDTTHTFRKEQHEHTDKKGKISYPNSYWIDGVTMPEARFKEFHANLMPADKFRVFTDLYYFNDDKKNPWEQRAKTLRDMSGGAAEPEGFDDLNERRAGRTLKDYKKMLTEQINHPKTGYKFHRGRIGPALEEKHRDVDNYIQVDSVVELQAKRDIAKESIAALVKDREELHAKDVEREGHREHINRLTVKRSHREGELKNDTSGTQKYYDEKREIGAARSKRLIAISDTQESIDSATRAIATTHNKIAMAQNDLKAAKEAIDKADSETCSVCGQAWPENMVKPGLDDYRAKANEAKEQVDNATEKVQEMEAELVKLLAERKTLEAEHEAASTDANKRTAEIDELIKNRPELTFKDFSKDEAWKTIGQEIVDTTAKIGEPVSEQLTAIEAKKKTADEELQAINASLNAFDTNVKNKARIIELGAKEVDLSQKILDTEAELDEIKRFEAAQNTLIEASVNGMFKHVEYKLFYYHQNGEYQACCVLLLNGKPYADLSAGEKIFANIDVINTLSDYYGVEVPIFIDHSESLTLPIEAKSQVIELYAVKGMKELQVEVAGKVVE